MSEKTNISANKAEKNDLAGFAPFVVESKELHKICDVCGYANSETAAMCKMCSNYLEGEAK